MTENPDLQALLNRANKTIEVLIAQRNEAHDRNVSLLVQANTALEAKDREIAELKKAFQQTESSSNVVDIKQDAAA
jgi:predicted RNase H-like nuclease (RuvC/YqgF family)